MEDTAAVTDPLLGSPVSEQPTADANTASDTTTTTAAEPAVDAPADSTAKPESATDSPASSTDAHAATTDTAASSTDAPTEGSLTPPAADAYTNGPIAPKPSTEVDVSAPAAPPVHPLTYGPVDHMPPHVHPHVPLHGAAPYHYGPDSAPHMLHVLPTVHEQGNGRRIRKISEPVMRGHATRKISIIKAPSAHLDTPMEEGGVKSRKISEGNLHGPRQRKISFITADSLLSSRDGGSQQNSREDGMTSSMGDSPLTSSRCLDMDDYGEDGYPSRWKTDDGQRGSLAFLQVVQERINSRASSASLALRGSRASFSTSSRTSFATQGGTGMASRPSMASLKETLSRVNLELHPEKGSYMAYSLGQSMASMPTIAAKVYIITQVLAAISVSMGSMAVGFTAGWTSPALVSMDMPNSTINVTEDQKSWVGSLMPLSALTGSIVGGYLVEAIGRKMLICVCGPPFILAYLILGSATNVWMLYIGRSIAGVCVGFLTLTLPVYLGETIQAEIRGTLGLLPTTLGNGGILICFLAGAYVNWSVLAYIGAIIPLIFLLMMIFVPETPRWYISKDREEDAYRSLCWLRGTNADVDMELQDIIMNHELTASNTSSLRDLFTRSYFKPFLIALLLMTFQQLSGINAVIFYSVSIFKSFGSTLDSNMCSVIIGVVNLFSTFLATAMIDRLGRKILLYISDFFMVVSLIFLSAFFYMKSLGKEDESWAATVDSISWLPLVALILYVLGFSLGWGPIPWLFMGEALPAKIRGPAASIVTAFNWACTFVITKNFPVLLKILGETGVFSMFAVIMMIGTVFTIFCVPETKGMSLEDIEAVMMGRTKPSVNRKMSVISGIVMS
uniref:Facilitated trehalose transporter Tret1-2 homolog n=1 Tax=Hirondellea gigas TaxID=1518452 RepID=A0A2P2HXB0_9CRUS